MKKSRILQKVGCGLIVCSLALVLMGLAQSQLAREENRKIAQQLGEILPPRSIGVMDQYSVMEMPVLQLNGQDYIALIEVPAFGVTLPVRSTWSPSGSRKCPCRFFGTVYDGTLVVGGSSQQGHLDFLTRIQHDDAVVVTDMTGAQYRYKVSKITRAKSTPAQVLMDEESYLTLFARSTNSLEYIIVRCVLDTFVA